MKALFKGVSSSDEPGYDYRILTDHGIWPTSVPIKDLMEYTDPFSDRRRLLGKRVVLTFEPEGVVSAIRAEENDA